jgi:D-aminopeptidase
MKGSAVLLLLPAMIWSGAGFSGEAPVEGRPRAREIQIEVGILEPGPLNAITDVPGVKVGHETVIRDPGIRTGVTVILPHGGNLFEEKVPGAVFVGNGFGKAAGITQIQELGTIETPIALTSTLNVPEAVAALIEYTLIQQGNESVTSINAVVGETNDGYLSDIRKRPITKQDVLAAIRDAENGPVMEGSVGAGTGTRCLGFKGGIGTSSRLVHSGTDTYTVGVLVQSNFGGILQINGAPVGRELGIHYEPPELEEGSCIIVVATNAPVNAASLERMAKRAVYAMGRTGAIYSNGSGDYAIAFSTHRDIPNRSHSQMPPDRKRTVDGSALTPLFLAVQEATEEAIYNSLLKATAVCGREGNCAEAIPIDRVVEICSKYNVLGLSERFSSGK